MGALTLIASQIGDIVAFLFDAVTLATVLVPVLLLTAVGKPMNDSVAALSLIIAGIVYTFCFAKGLFADLLLTLVPAFIAAVGCAIGTAFAARRQRSSL